MRDRLARRSPSLLAARRLRVAEPTTSRRRRPSRSAEPVQAPEATPRSAPRSTPSSPPATTSAGTSTSRSRSCDEAQQADPNYAPAYNMLRPGLHELRRGRAGARRTSSARCALAPNDSGDPPQLRLVPVPHGRERESIPSSSRRCATRSTRRPRSRYINAGMCTRRARRQHEGRGVLPARADAQPEQCRRARYNLALHRLQATARSTGRAHLAAAASCSRRSRAPEALLARRVHRAQARRPAAPSELRARSCAAAIPDSPRDARPSRQDAANERPTATPSADAADRPRTPRRRGARRASARGRGPVASPRSRSS